MNPLLKDIVGTWTRAALLFLSGWLIKNHVVTAEQGAQLSGQLLDLVLSSLPGLVAFAWANWKTVSKRLKFLTALQMAPGSTEAEVEARIKNPSVENPALTTPKDETP